SRGGDRRQPAQGRTDGGDRRDARDRRETGAPRRCGLVAEPRIERRRCGVQHLSATATGRHSEHCTVALATTGREAPRWSAAGYWTLSRGPGCEGLSIVRWPCRLSTLRWSPHPSTGGHQASAKEG